MNRIKHICLHCIPWVLFLIIFTSVNATCAYLMSKRDQNLIKIAFMNGSIEIMSLDVEVIRRLKQDQRLMKRIVQRAANRYLSTVDYLSRQENREDTISAGMARYKIVHMP